MRPQSLVSLFFAIAGVNSAAINVDVNADPVADVKVEVDVDVAVAYPIKIGWDGKSLFTDKPLKVRNRAASNVDAPYKLGWDGELVHKRKVVCDVNDVCLRDLRARRFSDKTPLAQASQDCLAYFGARRVRTTVGMGVTTIGTTVTTTTTALTTTSTYLLSGSLVVTDVSTTTTTASTVSQMLFSRALAPTIPTYASDCDAAAYSSACNCIGVSSTHDTTSTVTVPTSTSISTSVTSFTTSSTVITTSAPTTTTTSTTATATVTAFFARVTAPTVPTELQVNGNFYGIPDSLVTFTDYNTIPSRGIELYEDGHITLQQDSTMIGVLNSTDLALHFAQQSVISSQGYLPITCAISASTLDFSCDAGNGNSVWQLFGAMGDILKIRLAVANAAAPSGTSVYRDNVKLGAFFS